MSKTAAVVRHEGELFFGKGFFDMREFMPLLRDAGVDAGDVLEKFREWSASLRAQNRVTGGKKLMDEGGRSLRVRGGKVVLDGPYAEVKEIVGGYYTIL